MASDTSHATKGKAPALGIVSPVGSSPALMIPSAPQPATTIAADSSTTAQGLLQGQVQAQAAETASAAASTQGRPSLLRKVTDGLYDFLTYSPTIAPPKGFPAAWTNEHERAMLEIWDKKSQREISAGKTLDDGDLVEQLTLHVSATMTRMYPELADLKTSWIRFKLGQNGRKPFPAEPAWALIGRIAEYGPATGGYYI